MTIENQIEEFLLSLAEPKRSEMSELHNLFQSLSPGCQLWFENGKNDQGKAVANPSIGYGSYTIKYADGSTRVFYRIGISANTTGISVYILGLKDRKFLINTYSDSIGKATVTGYCIKFKSIRNIDLGVLSEAVKYGFLSND